MLLFFGLEVVLLKFVCCRSFPGCGFYRLCRLAGPMPLIPPTRKVR